MAPYGRIYQILSFLMQGEKRQQTVPSCSPHSFTPWAKSCSAYGFYTRTLTGEGRAGRVWPSVFISSFCKCSLAQNAVCISINWNKRTDKLTPDLALHIWYRSVTVDFRGFKLAGWHLPGVRCCKVKKHQTYNKSPTSSSFCLLLCYILGQGRSANHYHFFFLFCKDWVVTATGLWQAGIHLELQGGPNRIEPKDQVNSFLFEICNNSELLAYTWTLQCCEETFHQMKELPVPKSTVHSGRCPLV